MTGLSSVKHDHHVVGFSLLSIIDSNCPMIRSQISTVQDEHFTAIRTEQPLLSMQLLSQNIHPQLALSSDTSANNSPELPAYCDGIGQHMWPIETLARLVTIHPVEIRPAMPRVPKTPSTWPTSWTGHLWKDTMWQDRYRVMTRRSSCCLSDNTSFPNLRMLVRMLQGRLHRNIFACRHLHGRQAPVPVTRTLG